jgi:tetratricopeptide (TPR) repeat protein
MIRPLVILLLSASLSAQIIREVPVLKAEQEAWLKGDLSETSRLLHQKIKEGAPDVTLFYNLGFIHHMLGEDGDALNFLQKAIENKPENPYAYLKIAEIYAASGNVLGALTQVRRISDKNSDNFDVMMTLARLYILNGQKTEAEKVYLNIIDNNEDEILPRVALAAIYRESRRYQEAKKLLEENQKIYPEDILLKERARLYSAMGSTGPATDCLKQMCDQYPNNSEIQQYVDTLKIKYGISYTPKLYQVPRYNYRIDPAEKLDYVVEYGFITLGWLNVRMLPAETINGRKTYPILFYINSNPAFGMIIELHALYEAFIDAETMNTIRSRAYTTGDDRYLAREYNFQYDEGKFKAQIIFGDGRYGMLEKPLPSNAQDGVSMLYFARGVVSNRTGGTTTVVIDEEYKFGYIKYLNETETLEINDRDVEAVKIFARAEFKGVAGMNGDAWGWMSADAQCVPLKGKVSIIVGSITLEVDEDPENNVVDGKD